MESPVNLPISSDKLFLINTNTTKDHCSICDKETGSRYISVNLINKTITVHEVGMNPSRLLFILDYLWQSHFPDNEPPIKMKPEADQTTDEYNMVLSVKTYSFLLDENWSIVNKHLMQYPKQIRNLK